jgi:hypothetical protein
MSSIAPNTPGSQYTDEDRRTAAAHYVLLGNASKVSELTNIPRTTLHDWTKNDWWLELTESIRKEKSDEIDAGITRILDASTAALEDRIKNGDDVITKDGTHDRQLMKGRDLATVFGITFDKRQIIRNLPTSIKAESTDSRLNMLAEKVRELSAGQNKVISGESKEVED